MSWWEEEDWIDPDQWIASDIEVVGTTHSMFWVTNVVTKERGLFKPESNWRRTAYSEYVASKIGVVLGVPCAKILVGNIFGGGGCISMDVRKGYSDHILSGEELGRTGGLFNYHRSRGDRAVYDFPKEMSFQALLPYLPNDTELAMVRMMFFDSIIGNYGRHASNFSFAIDSSCAITAFLPLYDQGNAVLGASSQGGGRRGWGRRGGSAFPYYGHGGMHRPFPVDELYKCMRRDYPGLVSSLVLKTMSAEFRKVTTEYDCYDAITSKVNELESL